MAQEPVLFSGSVKDNIAYGLRDCEDAQVMAAAQAACADDFIGEMTNGVNTGTHSSPAHPGRGRRQRAGESSLDTVQAWGPESELWNLFFKGKTKQNKNQTRNNLCPAHAPAPTHTRPYPRTRTVLE